MNQFDKLLDLPSMPKAEARVEIAKDVLEGLKRGKLKATKGKYLEFAINKPAYSMFEFRAELPSIGQCQVCALGGLFVALVGRVNDCKMQVDGSGERSGSVDCEKLAKYFSEKLAKYFSEEQLHLIENHFEGWMNYPGGRTYLETWPDPTERMTAIMKNIVKNKGTFKP